MTTGHGRVRIRLDVAHFRVPKVQPGLPARRLGVYSSIYNNHYAVNKKEREATTQKQAAYLKQGAQHLPCAAVTGSQRVFLTTGSATGSC
jgi:hypothetical protein